MDSKVQTWIFGTGKEWDNRGVQCGKIENRNSLGNNEILAGNYRETSRLLYSEKNMRKEMLLVRVVLEQMHSDFQFAKPLTFSRKNFSGASAQSIFEHPFWMFNSDIEWSNDLIEISSGKHSSLSKGNKTGDFSSLEVSMFHELAHIAGVIDERNWVHGRDLYYAYCPHFEGIIKRYVHASNGDGRYWLNSCLHDYLANLHKGFCIGDHEVLYGEPNN